MKVWSGSAWAEKPAKVWSGTAWVTKPVKVWDGVQWVVKPPAGITVIPNCIVHWKLNDGSGADLSGSNNHGIFNGGVTPTTGGPVGNAALFDGASGFVLSDKAINIPDVTLSVWVKVPFGAHRFVCGFSDGGPNSGTVDKTLHLSDQGGGPSFYIYNGAPIRLNSVTSITNDTWRHVACVYEPGNMAIYIDGVLDVVDTSIVGGSYTGYGLPNLMLGGMNATSSGNWMMGPVDDFRVYNRALTPAEINTLFTTKSIDV